MMDDGANCHHRTSVLGSARRRLSRKNICIWICSVLLVGSSSMFFCLRRTCDLVTLVGPDAPDEVTSCHFNSL